jgi:hypothetical protein
MRGGHADLGRDTGASEPRPRTACGHPHVDFAHDIAMTPPFALAEADRCCTGPDNAGLEMLLKSP